MSLTIDRRAIKALELAAGAADWHQYANGTFRIPSQTVRGLFYDCTPTMCDCADSERHPKRLCKHSMAAAIVTVLLAPDEPYRITDADVGRPFARTA